MLAIAQSGGPRLLLPPSPLLPAQVGSWKAPAAGTDGYQPGGELDQALGEDGVQRAEQVIYHQGGRSIEVTAYQFGDATGAVAAFDLLRKPGMRDLPKDRQIGKATLEGSGETLFWDGTTVIQAKAAASSPELKTLEVGLPKVGGPRAQPPMLPTLLPAIGLRDGTVRYSLGPIGYRTGGGVLPPEMLDFSKAAEVATADYNSHGGKGTLTLLLYPTPEIAGDRGRAIEAWAKAHPEELGTVRLRREGPLLLLTTGAFPAAEAQQIIDNIHLRTVVTWDKKMPLEFHTEVQKTYSLLTSIAVLSGVLMLAAVLLGLFLGFGRATIRKLLGKPAATEAEFLGLGLEPGPAHPMIEPEKPSR